MEGSKTRKVFHPQKTSHIANATTRLLTLFCKVPQDCLGALIPKSASQCNLQKRMGNRCTALVCFKKLAGTDTEPVQKGVDSALREAEARGTHILLGKD